MSEEDQAPVVESISVMDEQTAEPGESLPEVPQSSYAPDAVPRDGTVTMQHPRLDEITVDVPAADVDQWVEQGWKAPEVSEVTEAAESAE